jgi:protein farnesyltransferase/geranylgeranyltransferase type-1 subunit alpha
MSYRQYRYETLIALSAPLAPELTLMDELAVKFLKTYQVWHHRRLLVTITRKAKQELAFIQKGLQVDEKNYHTWSYRQWILAHFGGTGNTTATKPTTSDKENQLDNGLWEGELDFIESMLISDIRNNSAWHHRFFVVWACGIREGEEDRAHILKRELTYVKHSISTVPNNPAAWNYLRGMLQHTARPFSSIKDFIILYTTIPSPSPLSPGSQASDRNIVDLESPPPAEGAELPVPAAIEFMADIWEKEGTKEGLDKASEVRWISFLKLSLHADFFFVSKLWKSLANQHDTVRKK